jgi:hypothetical protein
MGLVTLDPLDPGALTMQSIRASVIITDVDLRVLHVEGPALTVAVISPRTGRASC